jgi:hypothetical protein
MQAGAEVLSLGEREVLSWWLESLMCWSPSDWIWPAVG